MFKAEVCRNLPKTNLLYSITDFSTTHTFTKTIILKAIIKI